MKLKDIVRSQVGYQNRDRNRSISAAPSGTHRLIQIKDLDLEGQFKDAVLGKGGLAPYVWEENLSWVTLSSDAQRYLVNQGDVLFLSRGQRMFAIPLTEQLENVVASYYFYILHPDTTRVLPEYLAWFINQPSAQSFLEKHQRGSHIKMIPRTAFEELEIALPPLTIQQAIVTLERLRQKEEFIMGRLARARKKMMDGLALRVAVANNICE